MLRHPSYGAANATSSRNLTWGAPSNAGWTEGEPGPADIKVDDPRFAGPTDFRPAPGSPAIDAGAPFEPQEREGIRIPAYNEAAVGTALDIGAYEAGSAAWHVGSALRE